MFLYTKWYVFSNRLTCNLTVFLPKPREAQVIT